ncbi:DNA polymerase III subunit epsilon [Thioalkalivibrio sp. HK1]|uniref:DNA polymerase III subunit epsilon n=1 Tax=Thioalkalivibrio sp. HK1 TaxID=1469245 RepID=UPI0004714497|nr:DNA polymerase III subunit epsilon [Thioalkalivibrio sp. HK1]
MRQIVLDTETTGLEPQQGHRIIEIGAVELIGRQLSGRQLHRYLNPDRAIDEGALEVHGITREFLEDKPRFADVYKEFLDFIEGAELIIHNADFDISFFDHELGRLEESPVSRVKDHCSKITDSLELARRMHPGQRSSLDALCKRYDIDNSARKHHGALLDAEILAEVYLAMTGGQGDLGIDNLRASTSISAKKGSRVKKRGPFKVIRASLEERERHEEQIRHIDEKSQGRCLWLSLRGNQAVESKG